MLPWGRRLRPCTWGSGTDLRHAAAAVNLANLWVCHCRLDELLRCRARLLGVALERDRAALAVDLAKARGGGYRRASERRGQA